ncbi:MAG TPA: cereblon family protein, partial [Polyangiaceae bacterium]|nr:cereblon family protein [Polyangiaceae bacterium]
MTPDLARLREPAHGPPGTPSQRVASRDEIEADALGWYVCVACHARLAREDWVLDAARQGPLVFANPHGRFFELLLVTHVSGCWFERHATTEFTWFAGYTWRIGTCAQCSAHIGWHF